MTNKLGILITASLSLFALVYIFRIENIGTIALWKLSEGGTWLLSLILILLIASDKALLAKVQAWQQSERKTMRWGGGIAMMLMGLIVFAV
ncbi:MAG: hypothetical protein AAB150_11645 [Pseudomonadota bacterium]